MGTRDNASQKVLVATEILRGTVDHNEAQICWSAQHWAGKGVVHHRREAMLLAEGGQQYSDMRARSVPVQ